MTLSDKQNYFCHLKEKHISKYKHVITLHLPWQLGVGVGCLLPIIGESSSVNRRLSSLGSFWTKADVQMKQNKRGSNFRGQNGELIQPCPTPCPGKSALCVSCAAGTAERSMSPWLDFLTANEVWTRFIKYWTETGHQNTADFIVFVLSAVWFLTVLACKFSSCWWKAWLY